MRTSLLQRGLGLALALTLLAAAPLTARAEDTDAQFTELTEDLRHLYVLILTSCKRFGKLIVKRCTTEDLFTGRIDNLVPLDSIFLHIDHLEN